MVSRGLGKVERAVLTTVAEQPTPSHGPWTGHQYWLIDELGRHVYPEWVASPSQRRALQRAIRNLDQQQLITVGVLAGGREHKVTVHRHDAE
jgi:hypothetical protein